MLKHEGNYIGDTWYYSKDGVCHCYYLTCPKTIPRHTLWEIAHATSINLKDWELHGTVLTRGNPGEWDHPGISTGSVIKFDNIYWMAYTGQWNSTRGQIGLAKSQDLYHWEKCRWNPVTSPDGRYYAVLGSGTRKFSHWRDPYLFVQDGRVYQLICAAKVDGDPEAGGTVGLAVTEDMRKWELLPPVEIESISQELECPQIKKMGDTYVLLFSSFPEIFSPAVRAVYGKSLRQTSYYMTSRYLFGPYQFSGDMELLPRDCADSDQVTQYANQLVDWNGKWYLLGTVWSERGDYIADPIEVECRNGRLARV